MPRASSVLPLVNASGHQEVNISNASLAVNDATAQASLSSINGSITACNTGAVVVSGSALPSGASTSANQSTANSSLASIDSKLTAPLSVSSSATVNGSRGNLINLSSVVAGDFTTSVDISSYTKSSIVIKLNSSDSVELWISQDEGISYDLHGSLYPQQPFSGGSDYYAYIKLENDVLTDVKLKFTGTASSVTASCFSRA
tara:strand:- start:360 stop:962 length:603 start_codon:yes stop_codon:yes gene_type:complete